MSADGFPIWVSWVWPSFLGWNMTNCNLFNTFHTVVLDISAYIIQPSKTTNDESWLQGVLYKFNRTRHPVVRTQHLLRLTAINKLIYLTQRYGRHSISFCCLYNTQIIILKCLYFLFALFISEAKQIFLDKENIKGTFAPFPPPSYAYDWRRKM